jgi:AAA domain
MKFLNTNTLTAPWTRWFIYGDTGTGKTEIASSFPRPLFLVPRSEMSVTTLSGRNFPYLTVIDKSSAYSERTCSGGLTSIIDNLEAMYKKDAVNFPFDTIVLESVTHYMGMVISELTDGHKAQMDPGRYGKLYNHLSNIHGRFTNMDIHLVYTALAKWDEDTSKGGPLLPGQTKDMLPSACDVFAYTTAEDQGSDKNGKKPLKYSLHTRGYKGYQARTRFRGMPASIVDFQFAKIQHVIETVGTTDLGSVVVEETEATPEAETQTA